MTAPLVSVIIPIYNVEGFLDQALSSVEAQTLRDIEIICVNDGSTDSSPTIAHAHAARDKRVHVIDKPNGGYGSACNCGLAEARGTWIAILEPDDWIDSDMYESMLSFAAAVSGNIDVVKTPYWRVTQPDTAQEKTVNCSYKGRIKPKSQPFKLGDPGTAHLIVHHPSIWSALYRADFLEEHNIHFPEIPGAGWADNPFLLETLCQAESIVYLDRAFYRYREETAAHFKETVRNNPIMLFDRWNDMMDIAERLHVTNEDILRALTRRGFTYLDSVAAATDLFKPALWTQVEHMFERMDDHLVLSEAHIPPHWKRDYQRVKHLPAQHYGQAPYLASLAAIGVYNLINVGPAFTMRSLSGFLEKGEREESRSSSKILSRESEGAQPRFSIVVPVYNAALYLDSCLGSLTAQSFSNFEVICVDDGSTDSSSTLLETHARIDSRVRVVHKTNGGPSSARNAGIEAAIGDYVVFLDSDDLLESDACDRLSQVLESDEIDIAVFGWSCFDGTPDHWTSQQGDVRDAFYPTFEPSLLFEEHAQPFLRVAIRRSLLDESNIRFDETLYLGEDAAFLLSLLPHAKGVRLMSDKLYRYRLPHAGSIMQSVEGNDVEECIQGINTVISVFGSWAETGLIEHYPSELVEWSIKYSLYTILRQEPTVRNELAALLLDVWRTYFNEQQLRAFDLPNHAKRLLDEVLDGDTDRASQLLPEYRLAEYGISNLVLTIVDRLVKR
ncbi:MAG: glycosyltransferase [Eggerthellaceae bacterium]|nr:glycosyltransferase [Eggerthellaceae bacterium]